MASKSIQIVVNDFRAGSDRGRGLNPTTEHRRCSLCAQRSYTPLLAGVDRAFCAGDAAGCKPAGRTGQRPMFLRIVIPSASEGLQNKVIITQKVCVTQSRVGEGSSLRSR